jgi:hypothetical protein
MKVRMKERKCTCDVHLSFSFVSVFPSNHMHDIDGKLDSHWFESTILSHVTNDYSQYIYMYVYTCVCMCVCV